MNSFKNLIDKKSLLFSVVALWLGLEFIILGPFSALPIFDYADSWIPVQNALKANLFTHGISSWFPYTATGVDRLGQEHFYSYLPNLLAMILPIWLSNFVHIFLQYFLALFFTYKLFREQLEMSDANSLMGSVVYTLFCEFNPMLLGLYIFPLTLYYFDKIYHSLSPIRAFFLTVGLALLTVFCSLVIYLPYTLPIFVIWFLVVSKFRNWRFFLMVALYIGIIALIKAPSLMALLMNASLSHRDFLIPEYKTINHEFYMAVLSRPLPWLFKSIPALILLLVGTLYSRLKDKKLNFFLTGFFLTTIGACLLNLGKTTFHISLAGYQFDRYFLVSPFFMAAALSYAFKYLPDKTIRIPLVKKTSFQTKNLAYAIVFFSLFTNTLLVKITNLKGWIRNGSYTANFNSPQLKLLAQNNPNQNSYRVATNASLILPMYSLAYGFEMTDGYSNIYPMRYKKFWAKVILGLTEKNAKIDRYYNSWGNRIYLFPPSEIPDAEINFHDYYNLELLSLANTKFIISRSALIDPSLQLIQKPEREFYRLSRKEQTRIRLKENFFGNNTYFIYENKNVLPRFFVTKKVKIFQKDSDLLNELSQANSKTLLETVYLNQKDVGPLDLESIGYQASTVDILTSTPDLIRVKVTLDGNAFLVASNSYSPFWKVSVNNKPSDLIPADEAFWGVKLNPGENLVTFSYKPPYSFF